LVEAVEEVATIVPQLLLQDLQYQGKDLAVGMDILEDHRIQAAAEAAQVAQV
jgi:hypothetical protein